MLAGAAESGRSETGASAIGTQLIHPTDLIQDHVYVLFVASLFRWVRDVCGADPVVDGMAGEDWIVLFWPSNESFHHVIKSGPSGEPQHHAPAHLRLWHTFNSALHRWCMLQLRWCSFIILTLPSCLFPQHLRKRLYKDLLSCSQTTIIFFSFGVSNLCRTMQSHEQKHNKKRFR